MRLRIFIFWTAVVGLVGGALAKTNVEGLNPNGSLNQKWIQELYFDGEFEKVRGAMEHFLALPRAKTRDDTIFCYKYLSVVYAVEPQTKPLAENYMYKLLQMMPSIELFDLYVSESIHMVFDRVKERYHSEQRYLSGYDSYGRPKEGKEKVPSLGASDGRGIGTKPSATSSRPTNSVQSTSPAQTAKTQKKSVRWGWYAAGAALTVGAVTGLVFMADAPEEKTQVVTSLE